MRDEMAILVEEDCYGGHVKSKPPPRRVLDYLKEIIDHTVFQKYV